MSGNRMTELDSIDEILEASFDYRAHWRERGEEIAKLSEHIKELQAKVDELTAENSQLRVKVDELTCNDALAPEKVVTQETVDANDANADSREHIEIGKRPFSGVFLLCYHMCDV